MTPGYKQTEVGVIPNEWDVKLLPDVCRFRSGKAHEQYISETGRYVCVNSKFISTDGAIRKYCTTNFCPAKRGDVLMVMSDLPNGRALAKAYLVEANDLYAVNQRVCVLTAYRDCPKYIFYILNRSPYFLKFDDGVNQTHLLNHVFQKCPLPVPPNVAEQRAIAEVLSDVDALLSGLDQLIAKKRDLKQAAMQQLLTGETRLIGFDGEWRHTTLGKIISRFSTGLNPRQNFRLNAGGSFFYVTIKNFSEGRLFLDEECDLIDEAAFHLINKRSDLRKDDILFASIGRVGDTYLITETPTNWNINESVFTLRPDKTQVVPLTLFYLLTNKSLKDALVQGVTGSTFTSIKQADLKAIPCCLPISLDEQTAIADVMADIDAELVALKQRRAKTRDLKRAIMQELLTGKTRLI